MNERLVHAIFDRVDRLVHSNYRTLSDEERDALLGMLADHYSTLAGPEDEATCYVGPPAPGPISVVFPPAPGVQYTVASKEPEPVKQEDQEPTALTAVAPKGVVEELRKCCCAIEVASVSISEATSQKESMWWRKEYNTALDAFKAALARIVELPEPEEIYAEMIVAGNNMKVPICAANQLKVAAVLVNLAKDEMASEVKAAALLAKESEAGHE